MKRMRMFFALLFVTMFCVQVRAVEEKGQNVSRSARRIEHSEKRTSVRTRPMGKENFKKLMEIVENASFDNRKKDIVIVACMGSYFSSKQCENLLSLFSFQDNKLEALEIIAPRLTDRKEQVAILKQFTFASKKDKAIELLME